MKKLILLAITALTLLPMTMTAQDKLEASLSASLVSRYMWRGIDMAGISLQPEVSVAWKGLSLTASASTGFEKDDLQDIDLYLNYTRWGFNIGVIDYWTADVDPRNRYFYFGDKYDCPHQLEANIGYTCKYGSLQAYTMFYGNDYNIDGDRAYSTYIELSVPFRAGGLDWDVRAGITPMESAGTSYKEKITTEDGKTKYVYRGDWLYGESFTCNMVSVRATKNLEFKSFKLPVFVELHTNPYLQRANLILGISVATL
jgi:hypothetical protein